MDAAYGQHDVLTITAELAAHLLSSELVVARCCTALLHPTLARAAAASADVLVLVLEALRRHAECIEVNLIAWALATKIVGINTALAAPAVENGALELALATMGDTKCGPNTVLAPLLLVSNVLLYVDHAARVVHLGIVEVRCLVCDVSSYRFHALTTRFFQAAAQAMERFSDNARTQHVVCTIFHRVLCVPDGVLRVSEVNGCDLVCAALRFHVVHASVAANSCWTLSEMVEHGLVSSINATEAASSLAEAARRAHPSDVAVQKSASNLISRLLTSHSTPSNAGVSPERAALDRVAELKVRRDFASLVRDMDTLPECEELQRAGCYAFFDILSDGGSAKEATAAGAVECVVRALDLFQHSADTQSVSLAALNQLITLEDASVELAGNAGAVRLAVRALRSFPEGNLVIYAAFCVLGNLCMVQEAVNMNTPVLSVAALRRCAKIGSVQGSACSCLARLCGLNCAIAANALSMGAMELALAALRTHRSNLDACTGAPLLLAALCCDETAAVKAKQLGAPALLQAALKAHPAAKDVHTNASGALARIQEFVNVASARAEANMAELIAGEEAAKGGKRTAAPKNAGKGKGKSKGTEGVAAIPFPQPPIAADCEPAPTKAQIKRRKAKAAAAARKTAAASGSAEEEEEEEEEGSDTSSGDSELPRSRPPLDFSKDVEFRRRLPPITNSPLAISPELLAASDAILAAHAALYAPSPSAQPVTEIAAPQAPGDAAASPPMGDAAVDAAASLAASGNRLDDKAQAEAQAAPPVFLSPVLLLAAPSPLVCPSQSEDNKDATISLLRSELALLRRAASCLACADAPRDCVLLPCRHRSVCAGCTAALSSSSSSPACPRCRAAVDSYVQALE